MFPLDESVFAALNGFVGQSRGLFDATLVLCGQLPLVAVVAVMLTLWWARAGGQPIGGHWTIGRQGSELHGRRSSRRRCVALALAVGAAFITTRLMAFAFDVGRPLAGGEMLVPIDPDRWGYIRSSMTGFGAFPSDHAALFFAVAVGLFAWSRAAGLAGLAVATLLCLARISVGFHYPSDMVVGGVIGAGYAAGSIMLVRRSPAQFDLVARLFDEYPAVLYPLLFVVAIDFTQHFRVVFKGIFSIIFMLASG